MKFNKIIYLLFSVVFAVSCDNAIDIDQPGRLDADAAFQSVADLQAGLLGTYRLVDITPDIAWASRFTDEVAVGIDNGGQALDVYAFTLNSGSGAASNLWTRNYDLLNSANRLIEAGELVEAADAAEQAEKDNILGQAYFLRAFAHFNLLSYLTTDYTDDSALAALLVDFVPAIDQLLLRSTNGEFYASILGDLDTAADLLDNDTSDPTFANQDAITALRARIAAYREDYTTAMSLASSLMADYPLANRAQYEAMFLDSDNTEVIFKLERTVNDPFDGQGTGIGGGGWAGSLFAFGTIDIANTYLEMSRSLFNILDPADIRYDVMVAPISLIDPDYLTNQNPNLDVLVIQKYPGSEGQPLMNDLKVFRSSEMHLIMAEAMAAQGNLNGASNSVAALIKELRDARLGSDTDLPNYANDTEAWSDILNERRVELAYEGHRYLDLKRLGTKANLGIERDEVDCALNNACSLPATDFRFTFPLPIIEFNANPELRTQQNPGY